METSGWPADITGLLAHNPLFVILTMYVRSITCRRTLSGTLRGSTESLWLRLKKQVYINWLAGMKCDFSNGLLQEQSFTNGKQLTMKLKCFYIPFQKNIDILCNHEDENFLFTSRNVL